MECFIKYKELLSTQKIIADQINVWNEELGNAGKKVEEIVGTEEIKGVAANSIKNYMR